MSSIGGTGGAGMGAGREDLVTRLLGWWMRVGHWWRGRP